MNPLEPKKKIKINRVITYFLRKFKAYTFDSLMKEYAIRVLTLLSESFKLDSINKIEGIIIASTPHMKDGDQRRVIADLEKQSRDILDDFEEVDHKAGIKRLKKVFNK